MKRTLILTFSLVCISIDQGLADAGAGFTNFIRQVQQPTGVEWDVTVAYTGQRLSPLPIDPGGARFELWTVKNTPLQSHLLDNKYVSTYVPISSVAIRTEDPYATIPRTRADRPFWIDIRIEGLLDDEDAPEASQMVKFLRHVQSYGGGDGTAIDRTQATLLQQAYLDSNGTFTLSYSLTSIPGGNLAKIRGEERFSIFSLEDYQAPESQLSSKFLQIWPVADGSIEGITDGETVRFSVPQVTLTVNDMYPESTTFAQVYPGPPALNQDGFTIPGSAVVYSSTVPDSRVLIIDDWDQVLNDNGQWTMELLTDTPFGIDRLDYVTFYVNRTIEMNGAVTTISD